jgi:hypothetical protein
MATENTCIADAGFTSHTTNTGDLKDRVYYPKAVVKKYSASIKGRNVKSACTRQDVKNARRLSFNTWHFQAETIDKSSPTDSQDLTLQF